MEYWRHVCELPWFALHPASRRTPEQLSKTIPFGLHGDDVAAFKSSAKYKILAITCNSVFAHLQGSYLSRLPFVMMMYYLMVPDETLNQIWEVLVWSFDCLEEGTWPFRGHKKQKFTPKDGYRYQLMGQDLAGGHCGTFVQMRGDAKYYYEVFRWNSYHTLNCCHRCSASKVDPAVPFTEVVDAAWAATIRSHADFEEHCKVTFWTNLLELRGFLICRVAQDSLHGLNLGPAAIFTASCLWYMCLNTRSRANNIPQRLKAYWERFRHWQSDNKVSGVSVPIFDRGMLAKTKNINTTCPEFKIKAYQVRVVAAWLNDELNHELEDPAMVSMLHAPMAVGMFHLASFYHNMDTMPRLLSPEQAEEMAFNLESFLLTHLVLTITCQTELAFVLFDIRPKFHMMSHMVLDVRRERQNPKYAWCFGDEDYMHHVASLARMTHRNTTMLRVLERLRLGLVQQLVLLCGLA